MNALLMSFNIAVVVLFYYYFFVTIIILEYVDVL